MEDRYAEIPIHLRSYIVDQDYTSYTSINHSCWKFIMQISKDFFKNHAHKSYLEGLHHAEPEAVWSYQHIYRFCVNPEAHCLK